MADRYVWHGGTVGGSGVDWANAHTSFSDATVAGAAGDTYFVAHDHSETTAGAIVLTFKGSAALPDRVVCVNRLGSVPPVAADVTTGAVVATSGTSNLNIAGNVSITGVTFNAGTGTGAVVVTIAGTGSNVLAFENCTLQMVATGAGRMSFGTGSTTLVRLKGCSVTFSATGQTLRVGGGDVIMEGGSIAPTGAVPAILFDANSGGSARLMGVDLSTLGSGKTLSAANTSKISFEGCRLGAGVTVAAAPTNSRGGHMVQGSDSGAAQHRNEKYLYQGTLTTETVIFRTGGASDGTTPFSWRIAPTANNEVDYPFETFEGAIWNEQIGSARTLTVHTVTDNITLTNAECWLEADFLGTAGSTRTTHVSDGLATPRSAAANQPASAEVWTTTGLAAPVRQRLDVTFTPQVKGLVRWRVCYARTAGIVYVDPQADLT